MWRTQRHTFRSARAPSTIREDQPSLQQLTEGPLAEYLEFLRRKTPSIEVMVDPEARLFLSWDEVPGVGQNGLRNRFHTVEHCILSRTSRTRMAAELRESKSAIERELGQPCNAIAYPNGSARDVNEMVFEEVRAAGYDWAFMTTPVWQKAGGDPHRISRIVSPGHTNLETFKFHASGLHTRLSSAV